LALADAGERIACFVFEETRENFLDRAGGLGMDLRRHIEAGNVTVDQIDPAEISPGEFAHRVRSGVDKPQGGRPVRVVVIDSLNGYMNSMPSESFLVIQMHELLMYLNERRVLTLMVLAQHGLVGSSMQSPVDVTYLADTVILLRFFEAFGEVKLAIAVVKKRTGGHERSIREFRLSETGIRIGEPLKQFEGVLTGVPSYTGRREELIPRDGSE
jgi:circadian clock protein KaiC